MHARLSDIATQAGVSEATVSRVLNRKPGVAAATRQAVFAALDVLGYERPARPGERSAGLIGLIVPELVNPIFPAFAQKIETVLAQRGYTPVLCTRTPGGVPEDEYVEMLRERGVAGIIFVSGMHADTTTRPDRYARLRDHHLPIVLINGFISGVDALFISTDDVAAMELSVGHLVSLGHTEIGLAVGPARFAPVQLKLRGFGDSMRRLAGIDDVTSYVEHSLFTVEGGQAAAERLLAKGCTAIVCGSDMMALGAVRAVRARGLSVPGDVSIVGYDDSPLIAFTDPPLTTVRQSVDAMGEAAVGALMEEISGTQAAQGEFLFRPELVVRGSTGAARRNGQAVAVG